VGNSAIVALICATSSWSGNGGRPIRLGGRCCRRSTRFERDTPITSATVFIAYRPSAATAAAAAVMGWRAPPQRRRHSVFGQLIRREQVMQIAVLGIDLGKNSCSVVGFGPDGAIVLRRRVRR